jgi:hypothetical protein
MVKLTQQQINEIKIKIDDLEDYIKNQCIGCQEAYEQLEKYRLLLEQQQ